MNLFKGKVILEGFRVIGLKEEDKSRLAAVAQEPSFDATEAVVVPESVDATPVMENSVSVSDSYQTGTSSNIFDGPVGEEVNVEAPIYVNPSDTTPIASEGVDYSNQIVTPAGDVAPIVEEQSDVFTAPVMDDTVNGGVTQSVESNGYVEEDPALILADNLIKLIEDKNRMIVALNGKIDVLTDQLRQSEEARKVSDAQRMAAETTLVEARQAETATGGPTLVYQNNQAA